MISYSTLRRFLCTAALGIAVELTAAPADAATISVNVGLGGAFTFSPATVNIQVGDTVKWTWKSDTHRITEADPGNSSLDFDSGVANTGATFQIAFNDPGTIKYFCTPRGFCLPPGAHTAIVTGKDGTTGVALVETYRL